MEKKKREFDQGKARREGREWLLTTFSIQHYRKRVDALKGKTSPEACTMHERYEQKLRELSEKQKRLPASDPLDPLYRRLFYVRYADDYLIGIIGNKQEAHTLFREIQTSLNTVLKLELSE